MADPHPFTATHYIRIEWLGRYVSALMVTATMDADLSAHRAQLIDDVLDQNEKEVAAGVAREMSRDALDVRVFQLMPVGEVRA